MTKVLHVLDHSLPEQSGYAFRGHAILCELVARGIEIDAVTGPKHGAVAAAEEVVDGIRYRRTQVAPTTSVSGVAGQLRTVLMTKRTVAQRLREWAADVVHAHSPCLNGLAAAGHGVPLLYEMRSSWEDAAVSVGTTTEGSLRYRVSRALETYVTRRADEVVVICDGLKRDLLERGVAADKITVVPNAVSADMFELPTAEQTAAIRQRFGLADARVIGFFGSFFEWEGIDLLIGALPHVVQAIPAARLLLAGGGRQEAELKRLVALHGLERHVIFAGRVAHDDVRALYGAAHVTAYPRTANRLTELVTPLKPLEAMAQLRPVVASAVGGHRELIEDAKTGFLFPAGDVHSLARTLIDVLSGRRNVDSVVQTARRTVERERRWSVVAERYLPVYERMRAARAVHGSRRVAHEP